MRDEIDQLCDRIFGLHDKASLDLRLILNALAAKDLYRSNPESTDGICSAIGSSVPSIRQLRLELDSFFFRHGHFSGNPSHTTNQQEERIDHHQMLKETVRLRVLSQQEDNLRSHWPRRIS